MEQCRARSAVRSLESSAELGERIVRSRARVQFVKLCRTVWSVESSAELGVRVE